MSDLTPEEQRAVEAARRWSLKFTDSDADAYDCFYEVFSGEGDAAGFACGYLAGDRDGYKRGVEAAMHKQCGGCRDGEPFHPKKKDHHQGKQYDYLCGAVLFRALLAQEDPRG